MSDGHERDEAAQMQARALGAQQVADQQQARRQRVVERVGKSTLAAPPAGPQADRRLDEAMHKISNAASTAHAVWLPALQAQLRMGNLAGFENLYTQTTRDIASAERGLNLLERAMLHAADPSKRSDVEATLAVQHQRMLAQLMPVHNELRTLRVEADAAVARAAKGGPAAAPPMLATSASELDFGMVAIGEVSRPVTVTFANTSARYLAIDAVAVSAAGGRRSSALPFRLGAADTRRAHLMPGEEMDLTVYFEPTTATWPHAWLQVKASDGPVHIVRDVSLRGSTQPASARSAGAKPVDAQNRAQQASDALVAGATPAMGTSSDMLAAVLAAQTLTQRDTKASRLHADAILTQLLTRLAALRPIAVQRLAKEGSALNVFGAAADALDEWQAQLGLGARVATPVLVRRFQLAHEPMQFVLGETQDLPTLRPLYQATTTSALAITGGVLALPIALATLPLIAGESGLLASGGRMVAQRLVAWSVANPALALATTEMILGFAFTADPADYTWDNLCLVYSDPTSAAMFTAQMLMDIMHLRMAGHSDIGMSPTPRRTPAGEVAPAAGASMGNRSASTRPNAAETNSIPGPGHAIAASSPQPTDADSAILRQRVQKLIAVRDNLVRKVNAPSQPTSPADEQLQPGLSPGRSAQKSPSPAVVAPSSTPSVQNKPVDTAAQDSPNLDLRPGNRHVHEGELEQNVQSPYLGKWNGKGLHSWTGLEAVCKRDGFRVLAVTEDPKSGARRVEIERSGTNPKTGEPIRGSISKTFYPRKLTSAEMDAAANQAIQLAREGQHAGSQIVMPGTKQKRDGTAADGFFEATVMVGNPPYELRIQGWFKQGADGEFVITSHAPVFSSTWPLLAAEDY